MVIRVCVYTDSDILCIIKIKNKQLVSVVVQVSTCPSLSSCGPCHYDRWVGVCTVVAASSKQDKTEGSGVEDLSSKRVVVGYEYNDIR